MIRSLRILPILMLIAILFAAGRLRARGDERIARGPRTAVASVDAEDQEGPQVPEPVPASPVPAYDEESPDESPKKKVETLPDPETLIPKFEPDAAIVGAPDTGFTPPRWLDQNNQFLNEGDPYPPGYDPFRERPGLPIGWFTGVDLYVVHPEIDSQANNANLAPGDPFHGVFTNSKQLPVGDMNWNVMPKVQVGYRFENGEGEMIASYRFLQANSSGTLFNFDTAGAGQLQSRTTVNVFDLVYASSDRTEGLAWYFPTVRRYSFGMRLASWIFDTTATGHQVLEEKAGNVFLGGGPVASYDWTWLTASPSITFDGGFDAAGLGGFNYQRFAETAVVGGNIQTAGGRTDGRGTATPIVGVWGGMSWVPDWRNQTFKLSAGYRWERWFNIPDVGGQNDLTLQGPFVRGEFRW